MNYTYPGAIHIHSFYSDGQGDIKHIAAKAKKAGLSWIIITDHNTLRGYLQNEEGWYDGVAVIIGSEISPDNSDHYLALNIKSEISEDTYPSEYIRKVKEQNGLGFIAHPDESKTRKNSFKPLRWTDWNIEGFDGLEIWNYMSDWLDNMSTKNIFMDYLFRHKILTGPSPNLLKWWDQLNNQNSHIIPAIGGTDAHTFIHKLLGIKLKIFGYEDCFKTVTNFITTDTPLSESFDEAKNQILNALKKGQNTIINRTINPNYKDFSFCIMNDDRKAYPGYYINNDKKLKASIKLSKNAIIKLIHNGILVKKVYAKYLIHENLLSGKYRVEISVNNSPWIFTNPVVVLE